MWQEVITNEEAEENEIINNSLDGEGDFHFVGKFSVFQKEVLS